MTVIVAATSLDFTMQSQSHTRVEAKRCQVVTKTKCHRIRRVVTISGIPGLIDGVKVEWGEEKGVVLFWRNKFQATCNNKQYESSEVPLCFTSLPIDTFFLRIATYYLANFVCFDHE